MLLFEEVGEISNCRLSKNKEFIVKRREYNFFGFNKQIMEFLVSGCLGY